MIGSSTGIDEVKLYSEDGQQYLQQALRVANSISKDTNIVHQNRKKASTMDSKYLALNKKKVTERERLNASSETFVQADDNVSIDATDNTASTSSSLDYEYSSDEKDVEIPKSTTTNELSKMSLDPTLKAKNPKATSKISKSQRKGKHSNCRKNFTQQLGTPPQCALPLENPFTSSNGGNTTSGVLKAIKLPMALLSSESQVQTTNLNVMKCEEYLTISNDIRNKHRPVVVLLLRSGRFAGAVFQGDKCIAHRACQHYTVRRGQGGAQNSNDNSKGKAKSMGAQLRRAGEEKLKRDVNDTLLEWSQWIEDSCIVFISCPKTMQKVIFEDSGCAKARDDGRIRKVPLSVGRPTYEAACGVHSILMTVTITQIPLVEYLLAIQSIDTDDDEDDTRISTEHKAKENSSHVKKIPQTQPKINVQHSPKPAVLPLTPIHNAASSSNLEELQQQIESLNDANDPNTPHIDINTCAGEKEMTPLHLAASSSSPNAPECISFLLLQCGANPCIFDSHNRPPYYLATNEKNRDAFRLARSQLGEDYCAWDKVAKVGPPLTNDDIIKRKEKLAEKKRKQRQRQKEKKAKERQEKQEQERLEKEEEHRKQREEEAKRARAGLAPKISSVLNVCDFCQKVCKGMKRSQMFHRLDFYYCSTDCVKKHQRELTAAAALARFGGS